MTAYHALQEVIALKVMQHKLVLKVIIALKEQFQQLNTHAQLVTLVMILD